MYTRNGIPEICCFVYVLFGMMLVWIITMNSLFTFQFWFKFCFVQSGLYLVLLQPLS